jgi:hypothetical protein
MTTITETNITQQLDLSQFTIVLPEDSLGVVEYPSFADFPGTGKDKRLYIAQDSGLPYRWNGTAYTPAADLPATYSDTPPAHPYQGQRWTTLSDLTTYEWFAGAWVEKPTNN